MGLVSSKLNDQNLTLSVKGRVDTSNAAEVANEFMSIVGETEHDSVILDLEELVYISSAGLRAILQLRKAEPSLRLINASTDVYDILDMTGFTEIIPTEKAYRRLSVDNCELLGKGSNGTVYRIDPETIVKVYHNNDALSDIHRERELARRAFVMGVPTAIPYDVVKVGDKYGSVFELLTAPAISDLIMGDRDNVEQYVKIYVDLAKHIHSIVVTTDELPDMRETGLDWIRFLHDYLPADKADKLMSLAESIPVDHHLLHGDYHIQNVRVQNDEALLIDMDTLSYGHPIFELASMFNAFVGFLEIDHSQAMEFIGVPHDLAKEIWDMVLPMYFGTDDSSFIADIESKAKLLGYARILRRAIRRIGFDTEEGKKTINYYMGRLLETLETVDSLSF